MIKKFFTFPDNYLDIERFERTQIEDVFGTPLSNLLEQEKWSNDVQDKLKDTDFVEQFYK